MNTQAILDHMTLVVLNISLWQGRKTLHEDDLAALGVDVAKLPKKTTAALGTKKIVAPASLKVFAALKREAMTLCHRAGVRFVGDGHAVPREKVAEVCRELKRLKDGFETAKEAFLSGFDGEVEQWISKHRPEWTPLIGTVVKSKQRVAASISFNYAALDMRTPADVGEHGLDQEVTSLYGQLCHEIRVTARHVFESSFVGKQKISAKALQPITAIRAKLAGLSFLHPTIDETIQAIDDTLGVLPQKGAIQGADLKMVAELLGKRLAAMGGEIATAGHQREDGRDAEPVVIDQTGKIAPIAWDF